MTQDAKRMARRAARVGNRHPGIAARFYRRASTLFSQAQDHAAARECSEAADTHDQVARYRDRRHTR